MTEREFENLKVGDKVWIMMQVNHDGYRNYSDAEEKEVGAKTTADNVTYNMIEIKEGGRLGACFFADRCFLTKKEALENEIKREERGIENNEKGIKRAKERLEHYKEELKKAEEEEDKALKLWSVDFEEGFVFRFSKPTDPDHYPPSGCRVFSTREEAYEALAEHYKGKYEEALREAKKIAYTIFNQRIVTVFNPIEVGGCKIGLGLDYDGFNFAQIGGKSLFLTRQEAEAELKKEKKE